MRKLVSTLFVSVSIAASAAVNAEGSAHEFSANVAIATDYLFRGISQTDNSPAIQGGFDYAHESGFYVGTWASNVDFAESTEFDFYGGVAGELANGLGWDIGALYYSYPGSTTALEEDFVEIYGSLSYDFGKFDVAAGLNYSPDYFAESGDSFYVYADFGVPLPSGFALSAHVAHQSIDINGNFGTPDYIDWSIGISKEIDKFSFDVSYLDTDLDTAECFAGSDLCDGAVVFSISTSF